MSLVDEAMTFLNAVRLSNPKSQDRPLVIASWAQSIDSYISSEPGTSTCISGKESLCVTHCLRSLCDGILVGVNTVLVDNPSLTCRIDSLFNWEGPCSQPRPIILDSHLRIPLSANVLKNRPILVTCSRGIHDSKYEQLKELGVDILETKPDNNGRVDLKDMLSLIKEQFHIHRLMVEGGARVLDSFFNEKLVDRMIVTISPKFLFSGVRLGSNNVNGLGESPIFQSQWKTIGSDVIFSGCFTES